MTILPVSSWAQAPSMRLWQTYINAAQASDRAGDFKDEAITLNVALAFAKQYDANGQRPLMTRLPLMLAYIELERKDLWQPLAKQNLRIDVGHLDATMNDYIAILNDFGSNYYNRWQAAFRPGEKDFRQTARLYGAKNSLRLEIALREKLEPGDSDGLALNTEFLGRVLSRTGGVECSSDEDVHRPYDNNAIAQGAYAVALAELHSAQKRLDIVTAMSSRFSVVEQNDAIEEKGVNANLLYVLVVDARQTVYCAWDSFKRKDDKSFAAQVKRATELYAETTHLAGQLFKYWPRNPLIGTMYYDLAWFYYVQFEMSKLHAGQFPDSLLQSESAYEKALDIFEYTKGPNFPILHSVATDYVALLVETKQLDKAKKLEQRYGIPPPK